MTKRNYFQAAILVIGIIGLLTIFPANLYRLFYYTYLSNALVVVFYAFWLTQKEHSQALYRLKTGVAISILLTLIVYNVLLLPKVTPEDFWQYKNFIMHYIVPILTLVDWFLDKKVAYKLVDPLYWAIFPLVYCIFSLIKGHVFQVPFPNEPQSPYPYFFLNIEKYGWNALFFYVGVITVFYIAIGYGMRWVKNKK